MCTSSSSPTRTCTSPRWLDDHRSADAHPPRPRPTRPPMVYACRRAVEPAEPVGGADRQADPDERPQVDQALAVTRLDLAKAASVRYELTIEQAAAVAEFEDDPDTAKALVAAAKAGSSTTCWSGQGRTATTPPSARRPRRDLAATGFRVIPARSVRTRARSRRGLAPTATRCATVAACRTRSWPPSAPRTDRPQAAVGTGVGPRVIGTR